MLIASWHPVPCPAGIRMALAAKDEVSAVHPPTSHLMDELLT